MYFKNIFLVIITASFSIITLAQNKVTDSTATVLGYWKKGENISLAFKVRKQKFKDNVSTNDNTSSYTVNITVVAESPESYTLEWKSTGIKVSGTDANNPVVGKYAALAEGLTMRYKTDANGTFQELLNWQEVQKFTYATVDRIFAGMNTPEIQKAIETTKKMFSTKESIEQVTAKEVQLYHSLYGGEYKLKEKITGETQLPNFLGGAPFDAIINIEMTSLDPQASTCDISVSQQLDKEKVTNALSEWIKKMSNGKETSIPEVNIADNSEYKVDLRTGWMKAVKYKREVISDNRKNIDSTEITQL